MESIESHILKILKNAKSPVGLPELMRRMGMRSAQRRQLRAALGALIAEGKVRAFANKHYALGGPRGAKNLVEGRLQVTGGGFGFVRPTTPPEPPRQRDRARDDKGGRGGGSRSGGSRSGGAPTDPRAFDIYIRAGDLADAMDGDLVAAEVVVPAQGDRNPTGQIRAVLERAHERFTGWFQKSSARRGLVTPRDPKVSRTVEVRTEPQPGGWPESYAWVVVRVTEFTPPPRPLVGEIVEVLGDDDTPGIDVLLMLRDKGIVAEFPREVEKEAAALVTDWKTELQRRTDFRDLPVVTIDPETAKDFDDALSVEFLGGKGEERRWRLRVHIADVACYVPEGSAIDREAWDRATSIYPVDRVVPMLPERLSNDLCSLRPGEDRPAVTVEAEINGRGEVLATRFYRSIIHSRHRLSYDQAQAVFDRSDPTLLGRLADVAEDLRHLCVLARILRKRRLAQGALDLDIPEPQIVFDARGVAVDIRYHPRFESHQLVEECMLLANVCVAEHLTKREIPILYRVHETAQPHQLKRLEPMLRALGLKVSFKGDAPTPRSIQRALEQAEKRPAGHIFRRLVLRALTRARYSPENLGHFGLAAECYAHFTSPIRRYPDLVVHRALLRLLETETPPDDAERAEQTESLGETAEQCSTRERIAQELEWNTTKLKALEFMKRHIGEEFDGFISSVQPFGLFVELENHPIDGLVPVGSLPYDRYEVDDLGIRLVGNRRGRRYQLADKIRVVVTRINLTELQMDLKLADADPEDD